MVESPTRDCAVVPGPLGGPASRCALILALVLGWAPQVRADEGEEEEPPMEEAVDGVAAELTANYGWPAGTIQEQLDGDSTAVPFGKGAIFVPAMTNPLFEPPISVWQGDVKIAEGTTGKRIVVLPGIYDVELGTGAVEQRFRVEVEVRELMVSVVPVSWAGLAVHMVDERLNSVRGSYEIIRVETREYIDVGFGVDEQAGETVSTWILEPGLYKIVRVGDTYRARSSFATVRLMPGKLTDFLLVVEEDTGDFKGAGEVPRDELFLAGEESLFWSFVLGGDVNFTSRQNPLAPPAGESFSFRAFLDTKMSAMVFDSPLLLQLQIEQGGQVVANLFGQDDATVVPFLKTHDRADLDGLYVYKVFPWLGPYARFNIETNLFEGRIPAGEQPVRADILDPEGRYRRSRQVRDHVRSIPSFGLTSIKEGVGINLRVFKALFGETALRVGFGARHQITRQLIERLDPQPPRSDYPEVPVCPTGVTCDFYQQVPTSQTLGVEATIVGTLRLTRWVLINVELDSLIPFDDIANIVLDIESTLALKLTSFVSINYVFRYLRNPALSPGSEDHNRFEHDVLLRFSIELP